MRRRVSALLLNALLAVCAVTAGPPTALATVIFDDHFTSGSGGIPTGWTQVLGTGTAVESGSTVTLSGGIILVTNPTVDPNAGTVSLTIDIAAIDALVSYLGAGFADAALTHILLVEFHPSNQDGRLVVSASSTGGETWQNYQATVLSGYAHGPLRLVLVLGPASFSVSSNAPPFSSGLIEYSTAFAGFTRAELGNACNLVLSQDPSAGLGSSSIDRVRLEEGPPTPIQRRTFGQVKALYRP